MAEYEVANDLHVKTGDNYVIIEGGARSTVFVYAIELPALLARLTEAAEAMGVETVQWELVKALVALRQGGGFFDWDGERYTCKRCGLSNRNPERIEHPEGCAVGMALQALAKAGQR